MTIKAAYAHAIKSQKLVSDAEQKRVVEKLEKLQQNLLAHRRLSVRIKKSLRLGSDHSAPQGVYLWGGVGRGKTLLMDLFIDSLEIKTKKIPVLDTGDLGIFQKKKSLYPVLATWEFFQKIHISLSDLRW